MSAREEFIDTEEETKLVPIADLERELGGPKETAIALIGQARTIIVRDQITLGVANDFVKEIKRWQKAIDEKFDPLINKAHSVHKSLVAQKKEIVGPLEKAEKIVKPKIADYLYEEDQKRLGAQRAVQLAREKATRLAEEATDKAHDLIGAGKSEQADGVIEKAAAEIEAIKSAVPQIPEAVKAEGTSLVERWEFEVVDRTLIPEKYKLIDTATIGKIVRALHDQHGIDGIRAYPVPSVSSRIDR